jgi:4-hydroxy-tetrahydrodipicolinate synthase
VHTTVELRHHEVAMFRGSIPALITPFRGDRIDALAYQTFVAWQIEQGSHALFPCGTTGESPTLSHEEHKRVLELCIEVAKGRVPVLAGTGSNSTQEAIVLARHAERAGADAQVVVTPYYNKPNQEGLYRHFKAIHDSCGLPIIIYNIPSRCVIDMSVETMARLAELPRIVGVKDSTNDLTRPLRTKLAIGPKFSILSGEDGTAVAFLAQGGHGCISVTANVAPKLCAEMHEAWQRGDFNAVQSLNERLLPLISGDRCRQNHVGPVRRADCKRGNQDFPAGKPLAGVDHEIAQRPRTVVKVEIGDATDGVVSGADGIALEFRNGT